MYKVLKYFEDLTDADHPYNAGDVFPRKGLKVSDERITELSGSDNRRKTPLIVEVVEADTKSLSVAQLKMLLDEKGIEYSPKANKSELVSLLGE